MTDHAVQVQIAHTADLSQTTLEAARALLYKVFDDMTEGDWQHSLGGMHAVAYLGDDIVGHAALVQRRIGYQSRPLSAGYIEGVAVRRDYRGRGVGSALMAPLERMVKGAYDFGALGATDEAVDFYARRGWRKWTGRSYGLTPEGVVRTEEDDDCLFVLEGRLVLDLSADLIADWREGDPW